MHLLETETNRQLEVWFLRRCYMWCQKQTQTIVRHVICAKDVFGNGLFCPTFAGISFEKKEGQHRRSIDPWLACRTVQCELRVEWLVPPPVSSVVSPVCGGCPFFWFWWQRLERCQSTSIFALVHWQQLTVEITNVGDPRLVAKQPTACHHWCCSCPIDTACHCRHEPYGPINCPADIVPSYRWRNCDCHQTFLCLFFFGFFSSGMADHALMRRSTFKKLLHGHRWSHAARQIIKAKTQTTKNKWQDADPQPDLRLTIQGQQSKQRTRTKNSTAGGQLHELDNCKMHEEMTEITESSRTGIMLTDLWIRSKSQQDAVLSSDKKMLKGEKRGVKAELTWNDRN